MDFSSVNLVDLWNPWLVQIHSGGFATAPLPMAGQQVPSIVIVMESVTQLLSSEKTSSCLEDTSTFHGV